MHPEEKASVPAFLAKLWRLVEDPETNHLIYWNSDGRSFIIQNQAQFARELLPLNYKHNNMASFIRQLNMYGFHKINSLDNGGLKFDRDEMEFSHPCFQRGHPFMLENIKRKIAHARPQPDMKVVATTSPTTAVVKPETLNRVLTEVKVMRGKQEVLDNRFSAMKQENEALWREVVMLRQKHMKQQQIVNKLIHFLVTIVQPSGRSNMGMKRRLPLMLNDAPSASKSRKTSSLDDYGMGISSLPGSEFDDALDDDDDDDYVNLMSMEKPIVLQSKIVPADSNRGMISEIPNTPSSTKSHHDDLEDLDEIIEEEAPEEDVNKIFEELNEATSRPTKGSAASTANGGQTATVAVTIAPEALQSITTAANGGVDLNEFLKFDNAAGTSQMNAAAAAVAETTTSNHSGNATTIEQQPEKTWYANKDGFISTEIPSELFDDQSQGAPIGMQSANMNPTLSEDLSKKIEDQQQQQKDGEGLAKKKKFNGKHLQLARLPSNSGDVFSLATPEDFTVHLDSVQSDLNTLKGLLASESYQYDPAHLAGIGGGSSSPSGSMSMLMNSIGSDLLPKMFDDSNVLIPYQLSGDCLGNDGATSTAAAQAEKDEADKQMLQYNSTLDFSELLDDSLDDVPLSATSGRNYSTSSNLDSNGSLNTPQPQ